jgi:hypothetical protein
MEDKQRVAQMRKASDKLDLAIEAGERGDWPKAEMPLAEAKKELGQVLRDVEDANDLGQLVDS